MVIAKGWRDMCSQTPCRRAICVEDERVSNLGSPAPRRSSGRRSLESDRSVARSALGVQEWARGQAAKPVSPRSILQALPNTCECTRAREYCDWQRKSKEYLAFELNPCASAARETVRTAGAGGKSVSPRGSTLPVAEEACASSARSLRRRSTVATISGR